MKKENGITLIALVITIIVMLILVGVTVSVALNGGLFTTAKGATNKYTVEKEKELITIGYSNYQIQKYASVDKADLEVLEKYFLDKDINSLLDDDWKFIDNDIMPEANAALILLGAGYGNGTDFARILYNGNIYRTILDSEKIRRIEFESTQINLKENRTELELLEKYFLNEPNKGINDFLDSNSKFIGNDAISDAGSSLIFIGTSVTENQLYINAQYKNYIYKIIVDNDDVIQKVETESALINPNALEVQDANVEGNEDYGWTITFDGTKHVYTLLPDGTILEPTEPREKTDDEKLLEKYFLGEEEAINLFDVFDIQNNTFKNNEIISNADTSITLFIPWDVTDKTMQITDENHNLTGFNMYVNYKDGTYKVTSMLNEDGTNAEIKGLKLLYSPTGREGQKVTYSYDGKKEHEEEWTILYDNGSTIEIVSPNTMGSLKLGADNWQDIDKAITSYNGAISELNKYCREQITNNNKISVRSAGSDPVNPLKENTTLYTSTYLKDTAYDKKAKSPDNNWEQDVIRMLYWGITKTSDAQSYWLASRITYMEQRTQYI